MILKTKPICQVQSGIALSGICNETFENQAKSKYFAGNAKSLLKNQAKSQILLAMQNPWFCDGGLRKSFASFAVKFHQNDAHAQKHKIIQLNGFLAKPKTIIIDLLLWFVMAEKTEQQGIQEKKRSQQIFENLLKEQNSFLSQKEKQLREKSLKNSVKDGVAWSAMFGFGESFIPAFAVALKATTTEIGILASLPQLIGSLFQLIAARITEKIGSRKKIINFGVLFQALTWLPIAFLPILFPSSAVLMLMVFFSLYWVFGFFVSPAWNSLMAEITDPEQRGKYFAYRTRVIRFASFVSTLAAGIILQQLPSIQGYAFFGFAIIFIASLIARLISLYYLNKMHEPKMLPKTAKNLGFGEFLKSIPKTNFGLFVLFNGLLMFGVSMAGPYFAVYMLRDLGISYLTYTLITIGPLFGAMLSLSAWGKISDKYGNKKVLWLGGIMVALIPINWLFSPHPIAMFLANFFSGVAWAGFQLALGNYIFESTQVETRTRAVSYFNAINGIMVFLGAIVGSILITIIPPNPVFWTSILSIFLISGICRFIATLYFVPKIKEERKVEHASTRKLVRELASIQTIQTGIRETTGDIYNGTMVGIKALNQLEKKVSKETNSIASAARKTISKLKYNKKQLAQWEDYLMNLEKKEFVLAKELILLKWYLRKLASQTEKKQKQPKQENIPAKKEILQEKPKTQETIAKKQTEQK